MHPSGSLIKTALEDIRLLLNEVVINAKYDDPYIVRTGLYHAFTELFERTFGSSTKSMRVRHTLSLVDGQRDYPLPPIMQQVTRICKFNDDGTLLWDWKPRNELHPLGAGWRLEGSTLVVDPPPVANDDIEVHYIPGGNANMHYAVDGTAGALSAATTFTLSAAPELGNLGRGENEYGGWVLRLLGPTVHAERVIQSYDPATRVCTLRSPLPTVADVDDNIYEVVPEGMGPFWGAAATAAAMRLGTGRKVSQTHMNNLIMQSRKDMRTLRGTLAMIQGRVPPHMERDSIDNPDMPWSYERDYTDGYGA